MLLRIDNIFFVTNDVASLSAYYGGLLNSPVRRSQIQEPGLMWAEIALGGMELSFRKAEATTAVHPKETRDFLETPVGHGVTVSFEVENTEYAVAALKSRGCKFRGDPLICTGGMEVVTIFEDLSGRPVQLYEPRFKNEAKKSAGAVNEQQAGMTKVQMMTMRANETLSDSARRSVPKWNQARSGIIPESRRDLVWLPADGHPWGHITRSDVLVGSNLRDGRNLAYSVAFYDDDLQRVKRFYGEMLGLPIADQSTEVVRFDVDGTILEFRKTKPHEGFLPPGRLSSPRYGGIPLIEVRDIRTARSRMESLGVKAAKLPDLRAEASGKRAAFEDVEGNVIELWERAVQPMIADAPVAQKIAALEHWDFSTSGIA